MVRVKICGITNTEDAMAAVRAGADALGFVFAQSPRQVAPEKARQVIDALPPLVSKVGVFVDEAPRKVAEIAARCGLDYVQLHGVEEVKEAQGLGLRVIKSFAMGKGDPPGPRDYPGAALLLDTYVPGLAGGSGKSFDWSLAAPLAKERPIILAGGLNPENVAQAIEIVNPFAVDVSSGVEKSPGRKDHERVTEFVKRAKLAGAA